MRRLAQHKAVTVLLGLAVLLVLAVGGVAVYLHNPLARVPRVDAGITKGQSTDGNTNDGGANGTGLNILLAGTDSRDPGALARLMSKGWTAGAMRSDTIMVLHISADRKKVYLVSIPRD